MNIDNIINNFLNFTHSLTSTEIIILVVMTVILTFYIVYRWFGVYAVAGLFLIYLFAYILYAVDVFNIYKERGSDIERWEQILEAELMKQ
ncbi:hypothetical protein KAU19_04380 [Candidatus Parcubacteria bacterium]|nr:hypothetical protein [Candidatus Parcubacteria bacterium]